MNQGPESVIHWHITIVLDWKMAAVLSIPILIRLLTK